MAERERVTVPWNPEPTPPRPMRAMAPAPSAVPEAEEDLPRWDAKLPYDFESDLGGGASSVPPHQAPSTADLPRRLGALRRAVAATACAILLALVALVAIRAATRPVRPTSVAAAPVHARSPNPTPPGSRSTNPATTHPPPAQAPSDAPSTSAAARPPSPAAAAPTATPGGGDPALTSLSPATAAPGQTIALSGANFFSPSGRVQVSVGGQVVPTQCSSMTSCSATVPAPPPGTSRVPVIITTDTGTSNVEWLTYAASGVSSGPPAPVPGAPRPKGHHPG